MLNKLKSLQARLPGSVWRVTLWLIRVGALLIGVGLLVGLYGERLTPLGLDWRVAYISNRSSQGQLYVMDADSQQARQVFNAYEVREYAYSPDADRVAYIDRNNVYIHLAENQPPIAVTQNQENDYRIYTNLAWSFDGTRLAYVEGNTYGGRDIRIFDVTTRERSLLTKLYRLNNIDSVQWSHDGEDILFATMLEGWRLAVIDVDTSDMRVLDTGVDNSQTPVWSPDESQIMFTGWSNVGGVHDLYVMDSDGGNVRVISANGQNHIHPVWSPDGTRIAYTSAPYNGTPTAYVMGADGRNRREVLQSTSVPTRPVWSPDGSQLLVSLEVRYTGRFMASGECGIMIVDVRRGFARELVEGQVGVCARQPMWLP